MVPIVMLIAAQPAVADLASAGGSMPALVVFAAPPPAPLPILSPERPADAPPVLPDSVRAVIDAAIDSGDTQAVAAVVKFAKATNPETAAAIDEIHTAYLARVAERAARIERERIAALRASGPLDYFKGSIELGASRSTGNTDSLGLYAAVALEREGIDWRHKLQGRAEVQRNFGVTTAERVNASYQPNYKVDDRLYAYGLAQYERDRFLGYASRYTLGSGIGYAVLKGEALNLSVEGGPAVRHTAFIAADDETRFAGRASFDFRWKVSPTLNLTQNASLYLEEGASNALATTALDTRLIGALKARLSYNIQYQPDAPLGRDTLDTQSRATLVYSF